MGIIEGIGDEVTIFGVIILVIILAATVTFFFNGTSISRVDTSETITDSNSNELIPENPVSSTVETSASKNPVTDSSETPNSTTSHIEEVGSTQDIPESPVSTHVENSSSSKNTATDSEETLCSSTSDIKKVGSTQDADSYINAVNESEDELVTDDSGESYDPEINFSSDGHIHVRLKYLDDTERTVISNRICQIIEFKRNHFAEDIANNRTVRLIFSGQLLQDQATLQSYGVNENSVIHVQILQAQAQQNNSSVSQNADLELSHLLWPLISVILGICWLLYFKYPDFFNLMSLGMLLIFTGSFAYFYSQVQHR